MAGIAKQFDITRDLVSIVMILPTICEMKVTSQGATISGCLEMCIIVVNECFYKYRHVCNE